MRRCAGRIGSVLNLSGVANELGVDLVVERGPEVFAAEITSGATFNPEFTRSLRRFQKYSGIWEGRCHLLYGGELEHTGEAARVWSWRSLPALVDTVSG